MYVHDELQLAYVAHPRTGSRETATVLKTRGFRKVCGHHGCPWVYDIMHRHENLQMDIHWWFNVPFHEWTIISTVRNHFDVWASLTLMFPKDTGRPDDILQWMWRHPFHFRNRHHLWPTLHEFPERVQRVLRHERLREDVAELLEEHGLPPLADHELLWESSYTRTHGKEIGSWRGVLAPGIEEWIASNFAFELDLLGYSPEEPGG